jgi:predicted ABC-type ATPase
VKICTFKKRLFLQLMKRLYIKAKERDYEVILLFLWLNSQELTIKRVKTRVKERGHNIPENVIKRRYENGLKNLFQLYITIVDKWIIVDNSGETFQFIAEGTASETILKNKEIWNSLKQKYYGN